MKRTLLIIAAGMFLVTQSFAQRGTGTTNPNGSTSTTTTTTTGTSTDPLTSFLGNNGTSVTNSEIVKGLTDALTVGINNSTKLAAKTDGFYKNPLIFIPFPKEVEVVKTTVERIGMKKQVDDFVKGLNRAAETAAKDAGPIFLGALKEITITDGINIIKGKDDEATQFLKRKTQTPLVAKMTPVVKTALDKTGVAKLWKPLFDNYNKVPFVQKVNPDLNAYVTQKAIEGLFKLIGQEEKKIRANPSAWGSNMIDKVFGAFK